MTDGAQHQQTSDRAPGQGLPDVAWYVAAAALLVTAPAVIAAPEGAVRFAPLLLLFAAPLLVSASAGWRAWHATDGWPWWSASATWLVAATPALGAMAQQAGHCAATALPSVFRLPHDALLSTGTSVTLAVPISLLAILLATVAWTEGRRGGAAAIALAVPYYWIAAGISLFLNGCAEI